MHTMRVDSSIVGCALHRKESPINDEDGDQEQGTDNWLERRRDRLTASDFGSALGFWDRNGEKRAAQLWEFKAGLADDAPTGGWIVCHQGTLGKASATCIYLHQAHTAGYFETTQQTADQSCGKNTSISPFLAWRRWYNHAW